MFLDFLFIFVSFALLFLVDRFELIATTGKNAKTSLIPNIPVNQSSHYYY